MQSAGSIIMHLKDYVVIIISYKNGCLKVYPQIMSQASFLIIILFNYHPYRLSSFLVITLLLIILPKIFLLDVCMYVISILMKSCKIHVVGVVYTKIPLRYNCDDGIVAFQYYQQNYVTLRTRVRFPYSEHWNYSTTSSPTSYC